MTIISIDEHPRKQASTRPRWADEEDGDDFLLPPRQVIGPDHNGIKKVIEYKLNDENKLVRITTTSRVRKVAVDARLSKRAVERRAWSKFGDAVDQQVGAQHTMPSTEDILLERPLPYGSKGEESKRQLDQKLMLCRSCGKKGDHWTAMCPYKDVSQPIESFSEHDVTSAKEDATKGSYVPPNLRRGAERSNGAAADMRRRTEENSVRVTNLSEDTREADLNELCRPFGPVTRTYVSTDQRTGTCRGFGFVNFVNKEDAEKAIKVLNGYGYDNLILHVEWAAPRTD